MNYFGRFKDVEKVEGLDVDKPKDTKFAAFIRKEAENPEIFRPDFVHVDGQYNVLNGAFYAVMAARYHLDEESAQEVFETYNDFIHNPSTAYKRRGLDMYGSNYYYPNFTAHDYFINVAFDNQDEADAILERLASRFNPHNLVNCWFTQLAFATSYKHLDLLHDSIKNYVKEGFILENGLMESGGYNPPGKKHFSNGYRFNQNCLLGLIYKALGQDEKLHSLIEQLEKLPKCKDGLMWDYSQHYHPKTRKMWGPSGDFFVFHSAYYLELLKAGDPERYQKSRETLLKHFREDQPHGTNTIPYMAFLIAAQPEAMFS